MRGGPGRRRGLTDAPERGLEPFDRDAVASPRDRGWDAWAEEYARLPQVNPTYRFSKRLLYDVLDDEIGGRRGLDVLDFNCGCGNDFDYFFAGGHRVVGCDGSAGMLAVAARDHAPAVEAGRLSLYLGPAESMTPDSFGGRRFDLVLSATGGTAYLTDEDLRTVHVVFGELLAPGGRLVITHLTPGCPTETLYHLLRLRPRAAARRWRSRVRIEVKSEPLTMYLRSVPRLRALLTDVAPPTRLVPLNVVVPPFQTGYVIPERFVERGLALERRLQRSRIGPYVCDQVAWVHRRGADGAAAGS